jgi:hypothetical protein
MSYNLLQLMGPAEHCQFVCLFTVLSSPVTMSAAPTAQPTLPVSPAAARDLLRCKPLLLPLMSSNNSPLTSSTRTRWLKLGHVRRRFLRGHALAAPAAEKPSLRASHGL